MSTPRTKIRRVVVKLGTALITGPRGEFNRENVSRLVAEMVELRKRQIELIVVSSGAIGAGMAPLCLDSRPTKLHEKQAAAAVGQSRLMHLYEEFFRVHDVVVGQMLLTWQDFEDRSRYLNVRHTLMSLLKWGVVPIVNENDSVSVEEIKVGDNDTLAAVVATKMNTDLLVLLTTVDGFYLKAPGYGEVIREVHELTPELWRVAKGRGNETSVGGMQTKLKAAQMVTEAGIGMVIASGFKAGVLLDIIEGKPVGTRFHPTAARTDMKKRWLATRRSTAGTLIVDSGAATAVVQKGKSLLPSGVIDVVGEFNDGDFIEIRRQDGNLIARGLAAFSSAEIRLIRGRHSREIPSILKGKKGRVVVHRDNMTLSSERIGLWK